MNDKFKPIKNLLYFQLGMGIITAIYLWANKSASIIPNLCAYVSIFFPLFNLHELNKINK